MLKLTDKIHGLIEGESFRQFLIRRTIYCIAL